MLKPGGRVALAVWDDLERNPWMRVLREALVARGLAPARCRRAGPVLAGLGGGGRDLLDDGGFEDVEVEAIDLVIRRREPRRLVGSRDADPR